MSLRLKRTTSTLDVLANAEVTSSLSFYEKLLLYLNKELASAGYISGERVIFLGRKPVSSFGGLIDRYVKDYVICPVCGSPDTRTEKIKKLGFMICEACGARSSIKSNYA